MSDILSLYQRYANNAVLKVKKLAKHLQILSLVRLVAFLCMLVLPFVLIPINSYVGIAVSLFMLVLFLFSVKRYQKIQLAKKFEENVEQINKNEIDALEHQFSVFDQGDEFIDPGHINSYDLDIFGKGSLFQFLNRTVTISGKKFLAETFLNPLADKSKIIKRQGFVKELTQEVEWRQSFMAQGMLFAGKEDEREIFKNWAEQSFQIKPFRFFVPLKYFLYLLSLVSVLFWIFYGNSALFIISALLQTGFWMLNKSNIQNAYSHFGKSEQMLGQYEKLFVNIENAKWRDKEGASLIASLKNDGNPSYEISRLRAIVSAFENRNNLLLGVLLNVLFLWDLNSTYRLVKWHNRNREKYSRWAHAIAFTDASVSLANFAFNHPEYAYPKFHEGEFSIRASRLGHPLIHPGKRVDNDFDFVPQTAVMIVTGANMAGKSTFLRTLGVNMVLGACGAPVCARSMSYKPVEVFSNMRTTDSLFDDESYFFAELKRIKAILDEMDKGRELFIILDELLKGTNSVDKLNGSQKLVRRLITQKAKVIIATHDLKLTDMEKNYPEVIRNMCFEIEIINNEMFFDYRLRNGVTSVMNATFLMKKMRIIN
ncbi:MAG: hypothetical protein PF436_07165 [Prolixibacteraceae bacterium]|jgi:hypothetical protein|nr:hypothetical protein [Prolixibacteraceae bacterium]